MKQKDAIRACAFLEAILILLTLGFYGIMPITHTARGFATIILLDVLIVFVMFYIASPGLDKD